MSVIPGGTYAQSLSIGTPVVENPFTQNGFFINGATDGVQWHDMQTVDVGGGVVVLCGTQDGSFDGTNYRDSVCTPSAKYAWGKNQYVRGVARVTNRNNTALSEIELWSRIVGSANSWRGYEFTFSMRSSGHYIQCVRWNGALNSFDVVWNDPSPVVINDRDVIEVYTIGTSAYIYINGALHGTVDLTAIGGTVFLDGSPGVAHWRHDNGAGGISNSDYGWYSYLARNL